MLLKKVRVAHNGDAARVYTTLSIEGVFKEIAAGQAPADGGMGNTPDTQSHLHKRTAKWNCRSARKSGS